MENYFRDKFKAKYLNLPIKGVLFIYHGLVKPKSQSEDLRRREFVLNVILLGFNAILLWSEFYALHSELQDGTAYKGVSLVAFTIMLALFFTLHFLSRRGRFILSSYILVFLLFVAISYATYHWGINLPTGLLSYGLLIIISSILIGIRFSFVVTLLIVSAIALFGYLEHVSAISPARYWLTKDLRMSDVIQYSAILFLITIISWLSNRETEKSLHRARESEAELKKERDLLEVRVEERTQELKKTQVEKMAQLYRFSEFGRLSSGIFHDLINPLTAVAISFKQLQDSQNQNLQQAEQDLENGLAAAKRMEIFIKTVRKQLSHQETKTTFSLNEEIHQAMQLFDYKARQAKVELQFIRQHDVQTFGNPLKFHQIIANLISNAIDAYDGVPQAEGKIQRVEVRLAQHNGIARLEVQDWGYGIKPEILGKIFDPLFTTKDTDKGTGIGLTTTKHITEKDFAGNITVASKPGYGSTFIVEFAV